MSRNVFLFSIGFLALFFSCQDEADCISITTDFANLSFYKIEPDEIDTVLINRLQPIGSDSVLFADTTITGTIQIPLNPNTNSTALVFDTQYGLDTLILDYNVSTRLVAEDCGLEVLFSELDVLRNDFDSVRVLNNILVEEINEDIRIYN